MVSSLGNRRQQVIIALAAILRLLSTVLLGTSMAVYIGRDASPFAVSLALTAYHLGMLLFAPVWGAVADITGRRRLVLVATTAFASVAIMPLVFSYGVWMQIGLRWLYAAFAAGFGSMMLTIVSERGGADRRGQSIGFYNSVTAIGGIGGRLLVGVLLGLFVPSTMYLLITVLTAASAFAAAFVSDPTPNQTVDLNTSELVAEMRRRLLPSVGQRDHLSPNGLSWLYLGLILRNMTQKGIGSVLPIFLLAEVGVTEFTMGALLAVSPTLRTLFMYLLGRATDTIGRKPLIVAGLTGAGVQALVLTVVLIPSVLVARIGLLGLGFTIHAITFSALTTGSVAFIGDVAPQDRESELMGLRTTARGVGGVLGPLAVGAAATIWSYQVAFLGASGLAFVGAFVVARMLVESQHQAEQRTLIARLRN